MKKLNKNFRSMAMTVESIEATCKCLTCGGCGTGTPYDAVSNAYAIGGYA